MLGARADLWKLNEGSGTNFGSGANFGGSKAICLDDSVSCGCRSDTLPFVMSKMVSARPRPVALFSC